MKKTLFSTLVCLLLCALILFTPGKIQPASAAADTSALVGTSLYFDDQVDLQLFFDAEILAQKGAFSLTTTFNGRTYTDADLVTKQDAASGKTYKVLSVGPFSATQYSTAFTYSGSAMPSATFSLTDLARSSVAYYEATADYAENQASQVTVALWKAFANYGVAVGNKVGSTATYLPYELSFTDPGFTANPGGNSSDNTPLNPTRGFTARKFVLAEDVYLVYEGEVKTAGETANWTVTFNSVDVTSSCALTENGGKFSFRVPLQAEQGQEKLRIIIRDNSGKVVYDCIDRADAVAVALGGIAGYEELSGALASFLQAANAYVYSTAMVKTSFVPNTFYAGFGKVDITPYTEKVMLNSTYATEFVDPVAISCVALRDPDGTVSLIFSLDIRNIQSMRNQVYQTMVADISEKTGIDADHIFFNATHNHSAPNVGSSDATVTTWYNDYFYPRLPVAAKRALEDLTPVTGAFTGETTTSSTVSYNRRHTSSGYEDGIDRTLRTVRFERAAGKDILLVNWQCHAAHAVVNADKGSSDFIQMLREKVEGEMGMHLLYINGASGDVSMTRRGQTTHPDYKTNGRSVANSIDALVGSSGEKATTLDKIKVHRTDLFADLHYRAHADGTYCYNTACGICKKDYLIAKNASSWSVAGFNSENEYNAYVDQKNNANLPYHHTTIELWTMTISDDIGFVFVPYEMFNQNGVALRNAVNAATGGGKTIITAGYTNGYLGYMPSERAWQKVDNAGGVDDGAHEVHTARHVRGTAERCINQLAQDLTALFNN